MASDTSGTLAATCTQVADLAGQALEWITDERNAGTVDSQAPVIARELRRAASRARKLAVAAERNMCVGVFGPSQAGKSFLSSVLAAPPGGALVADFAEPTGRRNFIAEINPPGERESTGLVTRFTMRREPSPPGFPIKLRLLSEADLVRVLANTFLKDGDQSEAMPAPEEIDGLITSYGRKRGEGRGMSADEVWDIREYVENNFGKAAYVNGLKGFWEDAAEIAPTLSLADRAAFLAILWGRHRLFTELYVLLAGALAKIGHAAEIHAAPEALFPKERSIIDVEMLVGLDVEGPHEELSLCTPTGIKASLPKPVVTALTAELILPMAEQPSEIFGQTDLLDFPGARGRFTAPIEQTFRSATTPRRDTFLRGKVAYLFDRYVAEQELTSMLLCIGPSNMEVTDLPGLVDGWVRLTHGATPAERAHADCILFFMFTKFDLHLGDNAATGSDPVTRFERRVDASLLAPFGKLVDSWVNNWADGQPFRNSFMLRNPNYPVPEFFRYDEDLWKREEQLIELGRLREDRIAELKAGCLSVPAIQRHFADPERAWDSLMKLNDGGVSYLVEKLTPVCKPEIKSRQIGAQLAVVCRQITSQIERFYISDDIEQRLEEKRAAAGALIEALNHAYSLTKFGEVLNSLTVDPDRIADRILRVPDGISIVAGSSQTAAPARAAPGPQPVIPGRPRPVMPGAAAGGPRPILPNGLTPGQPPAPREAETKTRIRSMTREVFQAEVAMKTWIETLNEFARRPDLYDHFGIPPEAAEDLTGEMLTAARRFGLQGKLAEDIARLNFALQTAAQSGPVATVAGDRINRFVVRLGADLLPPDRRPKVTYDDGSTVPVFQPKPVRFGADDLPAVETGEAAAYLTDWLYALYGMFEDNAKNTAGADVDIEQNLRLGSILRNIEAAVPAP